MKSKHEIQIIDITRNRKYEKYLYTCITPFPFRKHRKRHEYLVSAIPKGFQKRLSIFDGEVAGQIEYAPTEASGYPIIGDDIIVMNCIWVLRRAKGHDIGKQLFAEMMKSERDAAGFATIALENHWSPWLRKEHMEYLGFGSIDSVSVRHRTKHVEQRFKIHLMWLPTVPEARPPSLNHSKLLEGVDFCFAHPLYRPEKTKVKEILQR